MEGGERENRVKGRESATSSSWPVHGRNWKSRFRCVPASYLTNSAAVPPSSLVALIREYPLVATAKMSRTAAPLPRLYIRYTAPRPLCLRFRI